MDSHDWQREEQLADVRAFEMMHRRRKPRLIPKETTDEYLTQIERENVNATNQ